MASTPNPLIVTGSQEMQVGVPNDDGQQWGTAPTDRIAAYGANPVSQKSSVLQSLIQAGSTGEIVTFQTTQSPVSVAINTIAEQSLTVAGLLATDYILAVNKPTSQAGLGLLGWRISAANTMYLTFGNNTGAIITPTPSETYSVTVLRGLPTVVAPLTPAAVPAGATVEQIFSIAGSGAAATAIVNPDGTLGSVIPATGNTGGSGFYLLPQISVVDPLGQGDGAVVVPIISGGAITGYRVTHHGKNYTPGTPPNIVINGLGNMFGNGMHLFVQKAAVQAGLGVGGCRIVGNGQVAITYVNNTAAAITPTAAENYTFFACNTMPNMSPLAVYGVNVPSASVSTASVVTADAQFTVTGLAASDIVVSAQKPSITVGLFPTSASRASAANTLQINMANVTATTVTPAGAEVYSVTVLKISPPVPAQIYKPFLTPVSVAANTTAEQTFTVTGLPAGSVVSVNKPSAQSGLTIQGFRVSALNTLAITYANNTAGAIVPSAEAYTVCNFTAPGPGAGNSVALPVSQTFNQLVDLVNEAVMAETVLGLIKGA